MDCGILGWDKEFSKHTFLYVCFKISDTIKDERKEPVLELWGQKERNETIFRIWIHSLPKKFSFEELPNTIVWIQNFGGVYSKTKIIMLIDFWNLTVMIGKRRGEGNSLIQLFTQIWLRQSETRSLEFHLGLPYALWGSKHLVHLLLLSQIY